MLVTQSQYCTQGGLLSPNRCSSARTSETGTVPLPPPPVCPEPPIMSWIGPPGSR
jgi:hypothetical protein